MVHQREIRRPLETVCAESDWPLVAKTDHCRGSRDHPGPEMGGGGGGCSPKKFFQPFGPQFGLKIGGGQAPLLDLQRTVKDWCDVTQCQGLNNQSHIHYFLACGILLITKIHFV